MKTEIIQVVKLNPESGMHLKNKKTGEIYENYIYLAKSLSAENFEEITGDEYKKAVADREKDREKKELEKVEKERK